MRTVLSGTAPVHYGQIYVQSGERWPELPACFVGQRNGLCGAAMPGTLFMTTGLHSGIVSFTVEVHESPPDVDESWEEIVEVSFHPAGEAALCGWAGERWWPLDLAEIDYRVRYCASAMDAAQGGASRFEDDEPEIDRYLLQFWPAPPAPDEVVKETSETAAYWHDYARKQ